MRLLDILYRLSIKYIKKNRKKLINIFMVIIGYVRVSSKTQNIDSQINALKTKYPQIQKMYQDVQSGVKQRPGLEALLDFVREDDQVIVLSLDRLARSLVDLLNIVQILRDKKVTLVSITEPNFGSDTPGEVLNLHIFAAVAQYQRTLLLARQKDGILLAKERGLYKGRRKVSTPPNFDLCYQKYKDRGNRYTFKQFLFDTRLKRYSLTRMIKEKQEQEKQKQEKQTEETVRNES
jgi:DNA invertase Pin-like site-specific DNA recombinase